MLDSRRGGPQKDVIHFAEAAVAAIRGGHCEAAQSLLSSVIESLVKGLDDSLQRLVRSHSADQTVEARAEKLDEEYEMKDWLALQPVLAAYRPFWASKGDPVPRTYSRHASAHFVARKQFNKRNTAQALLCATSLATYLYDWPDVRWPDEPREGGSDNHDGPGR
jgi:hypothetical protein